MDVRSEPLLFGNCEFYGGVLGRDILTTISFEAEKRLISAVVLAGALLLLYLLAVGASRSAADTGQGDRVQSDVVGINGAPCAYADVAAAAAAASDGDTIYVSHAAQHKGLIGRLEHDLTIVSAADDCETMTTTETYLDGDGGSWAPSGGLAVIASGETVTFSSIRLVNAHAANQGGIVFVEQDATLVLNGSYVQYGKAGGRGGGIYVSTGGGLVMSDSIVDNNDVTETTTFAGGGGGVYVYRGTMTMTNGSWVGRTSDGNGNGSAQDGGGIYLYGSSLHAIDSFVLNNVALHGGGVFATRQSSIRLLGEALVGADTVRDPAFANFAVFAGGGVYLDRDSLLVMGEQAEVLWNTAVDFGGGMYAAGDSEVAIHNDSRVYSNTATFGGGAYLTGAGTVLNMFGQNVKIESNRALEGGGAPGVANGGGIYVTGSAEVHANATKIISNHADLLGGGLYVAQDGASSSTIAVLEDGAEVSGNGASYGGGAYLGHEGSRLTVDNASICANVAITRGGGIRTFGDNTLVVRNGSVISGNFTFDEHGGGLSMEDGRGWIADAWMENNVAGAAVGAVGNGGAVRVDTGVLTMTNSSMVGNAAYAGGGISVRESSVVLTNVKVISNYASQVGGGISLVFGDLEMGASFGPECMPGSLPAHAYCSEVRGNETPGAGAGVSVEGPARATIVDTAFLENRGTHPAGSNGAALGVGHDADVSVTNGLFSENGANSDNAVYVGANATYWSDNSTYAGNQDVPLFVESQGSVTLTLNIIWDNGLPSDIRGSLSSRCNDTQVGLGGSDDISQDPQFINLRGPYRLGPNSPAIDACIGLVDHDLDGKLRPLNVEGAPTLFSYDMGAFEARSPVFVPLVLRRVP